MVLFLEQNGDMKLRDYSETLLHFVTMYCKTCILDSVYVSANADGHSTGLNCFLIASNYNYICTFIYTNSLMTCSLV